MAYLVFARKYRPQTFREVVAQQHVTQTLANAVSSNRVAHAILFSGPRGTGKTTVARILAKAMNCVEGPTAEPCNVCQSCTDITSGHAADVFEIDGASNNSVDQIRELRDNIKYMPANSAYKIYIIDEVHMLSLAAFNALLKTLEEPPGHILFFFATTEPHKIPITILSRCQRYDMRRIDTQEIANHLGAICNNENIPVPDESLWVIAREADGSMRDSLSLLDQVVACSHGKIDHGNVLNILGLFDAQELFTISDAVFKGDIPSLLSMVDTLYKNGKDLKKLYYDLRNHFRNLFVLKTARQPEKLVAFQEPEMEAAQNQLKNVTSSELGQLLDLFSREESAIRMSVQPRIALEMAFVRMARTKPALPIETLIERLDMLREDIAKGGGGSELYDAQADYGESSINSMSPQKTSVSPASPPTQVEPSSEPMNKDIQRPSGDGDLTRAWQRILRTIADKHSSLAPNLSKSRIVNLTGNQLQIEIRGTSFNMARVKREKNISILKNICSDVFGREVTITLHEKADVSENRTNTNGENQKLKSEALDHPLVTEAIHQFDGKVVDVKILRSQTESS